MRYPGGVKLAYLYDFNGYLTHERDPVSGLVYRQTTVRNARHQTEGASLANGAMTQVSDYHGATGQMATHAVTAGTPIVNFGYSYDSYGNLKTATTAVNGSVSSETFDYDPLHRLTSSARSTPNGSPLVTYTYDPAGNILSKSDYATLYHYQGAGPNAVSSVTLVGGGSATFGYDGNGNMTVGHGKTLTYNAFNKPLTVKIGSTIVDAFSYGADLMRYRHQKDSGTITWYLDKYLEIVNLGSTWDYRHYLGDVAILTKTGSLNDPSPSIDFIHRDRLGNVAKLTNAAGGNPSGTSPSGRGFDPYGKPRNEDWSDRAAPPTGATLDRSQTERGFTDHEHLDQAELIHMNGRAFDYNLGRFLSVDPFIQAPGNSQALNPYSYIMNNPLAGTDPSRYTWNMIQDYARFGCSMTCIDLDSLNTDPPSEKENVDGRTYKVYSNGVSFTGAGQKSANTAATGDHAGSTSSSSAEGPDPTTIGPLRSDDDIQSGAIEYRRGFRSLAEITAAVSDVVTIGSKAGENRSLGWTHVRAPGAAALTGVYSGMLTMGNKTDGKFYVLVENLGTLDFKKAEPFVEKAGLAGAFVGVYITTENIANGARPDVQVSKLLLDFGMGAMTAVAWPATAVYVATDSAFPGRIEAAIEYSFDQNTELIMRNAEMGLPTPFIP